MHVAHLPNPHPVSPLVCPALSRHPRRPFSCCACSTAASSSLRTQSAAQNAALADHGGQQKRGATLSARAKISTGDRSHTAAVQSGGGLGVVITGGSRGLGFALAREHLAAGDSVVICGRDGARLRSAAEALRRDVPDAAVHATVCDVSNGHDVAALGDFAVQRLGVVHRWINNAGQVTRKRVLADLDAAEIADVVGANVLGSLLCCREAIRIMRAQPATAKPVYHIFNMGFSSWGAKLSKTACTHKSTKSALTQLNVSLAEDLATAGLSHIGVHNLSPGMVLTDLLLKDSTPTARRFFNALAEEPETAAAELVPRIRNIRGTATSIDFLNPASAVLRVLTGVPQIIGGGRFFDKNGDRVRAEDCVREPSSAQTP